MNALFIIVMNLTGLMVAFALEFWLRAHKEKNASSIQIMRTVFLIITLLSYQGALFVQ